MDVLLIEDDIQLNTTINAYLKFRGYNVTSINDGESAVSNIDEKKYDLYIIDVNLPNVNGLDLVKYIRNKDLSTPIIMITASLEIDNLKTAFKNGCDEYLKKPFHLEELEIRINKTLDKQITNIIPICSNITYDLDYDELKIDGSLIRLRKKEGRLLSLLVQNIDRVVSFESIEDYVWENEIKEVYPIRQLMTELKRHFKEYTSIIQTERGRGYKLIQEKR